MTEDSRSGRTVRRWIGVVLAAAGLAALPACGGDERPSRDAFEDRLQSIERWGSMRYARLAEQATHLRPDQPLTDELKRAMKGYARWLARAAEQLDDLNAPQAAERQTALLIEALRERASGFEQAAKQQRTTLRDLERQRSTTQAGERIDRAFEQLREDGFLMLAPDHPDEHPHAGSRREARSGEAHRDAGYYRTLSRRWRASTSTRRGDHAP